MREDPEMVQAERDALDSALRKRDEKTVVRFDLLMPGVYATGALDGAIGRVIPVKVASQVIGRARVLSVEYDHGRARIKLGMIEMTGTRRLIDWAAEPNQELPPMSFSLGMEGTEP